MLRSKSFRKSTSILLVLLLIMSLSPLSFAERAPRMVDSQINVSGTVDESIEFSTSASHKYPDLIGWKIVDDVGAEIPGFTYSSQVISRRKNSVNIIYTPQSAGTFNYYIRAYITSEPNTYSTIPLTIYVESNEPTNQAPTINDHSFAINEGGTLNDSLVASDPDQDTLTFEPLSQPTSGTLTLNPNGSFTYVQDSTHNGSDSFDVKVTDPDGLTDSATITININSTNQAPEINNQAFTIDEGGTLIDSLVASDPDEDSLTFEPLSQPTSGSLTLSPNGSFTYVQTSTHNGTDSFDVKVTDPDGLTDSATITININSTNQAPEINNQAFTIDEGGTLIDSLVASDPDEDSLTFEPLSQPTSGSLTLSPNGSFTYVQDSTHNGSDSFDIKVTDPDGLTDSATVTVNIVTNVPTIAVDDYGNASIGNNLTIDVLSNDSDPDDTLEIVSVTQPNLGSVAIQDNKVVYTPSEVGQATFTYTLNTDVSATVYVIVSDDRINYVILGDSIATGHYYTSSDTRSYAELFYTDYLRTLPEGATVEDLSINGITSMDMKDMLTNPNNQYYGQLQSALRNADVVTLAIGANNIMRAAKVNGTYYFFDEDRIQWDLADSGIVSFREDWNDIINAIHNANIGPDPLIMVETLYNPYNTSERSLHPRVNYYMTNSEGTGVNDIIHMYDDSLNYVVIDVYDYFYTNYSNNMGAVTHFYDWWGLVHDPHPNNNGHEKMKTLHVNYYKSIR